MHPGSPGPGAQRARRRVLLVPGPGVGTCDEGTFTMSAIWLVSIVLLWAVVVFLGFLLLGTLRALGLLRWRLEQLEATTPKRLGRDGLKPGKKAPNFTLPS